MNLQIPPIEPIQQGSDGGGILGFVCIVAAAIFFGLLFMKLLSMQDQSEREEKEED